jgi:hypothetical protein
MNRVGFVAVPEQDSIPEPARDKFIFRILALCHVHQGTTANLMVDDLSLLFEIERGDNSVLPAYVDQVGLLDVGKYSRDRLSVGRELGE